MKLKKKLKRTQLMTILSTHPEAGGLMKPRPLKPLSTQADNALLSADFKVFISALSSRGS